QEEGGRVLREADRAFEEGRRQSAGTDAREGIRRAAMRVAAVLLAAWALGGAALPAHADPTETDPDLAATDPDYAAARKAIVDKQWEEAIARLRKAEVRHPDHADL